MDKSNLAEIRKVIRKNDPPVDWIYSFYVTPENELAWQSFRKFLSFDEDESFRFKDILKKSLSGTQGKELFSVPLDSQSEKLFSLRTMDEADEEILQEFAGHVISSYTHTDPYLAVCARITYDVPGMSSDRRKLEDGEVVFQSILFAICPAKLSSPALGFDDAEGVSELSRRWTIGAPVEGFLYPSFNDRIGDLSEVLYRSKKEISGELFAEFFNAELPYTAKMQKEAFNTLMDSLNVSVESAAVLQEDLAHLDAEDISVLEKNDVKKLAERCGIETEHFDESFDDIIGTIPLDIAAIRENAIVVATDSATIKVPAEKSRFIKTRVIGGVSYILIPVDGAVLVNGIPAVPEELMKTFKSEGSFEADGKAADDAAVTDEDFSDDRTQEDTDVFGEDLPEDPDTGEQGQDDEDIFGEDFPEDFPAPF